MCDSGSGMDMKAKGGTGEIKVIDTEEGFQGPKVKLAGLCPNWFQVSCVVGERM